jgi:hypothetical protein
MLKEMKTKMKEYKCVFMERGFQFEMVVVAPTLKSAAELIGESPYYIKNYGYIFKEPRTKEAIEDPLTRFAIFPQYGGELWVNFPEKRGKIMKFIHFQSFVNEYLKSKY